MRLLENAVVRLEPQVAAHAQAMFEVLADPAIYEHENAPPPSVEWLRSRYARLEQRVSPDGSELWLNWVIRLPSSALAGYVQATVHPTRRAAIAYELNSRYWGQGLARSAVQLMIAELAASYDVTTLSAVLKARNLRSRRLLDRLGCLPAPQALYAVYEVEPDEILMLRAITAA